MPAASQALTDDPVALFSQPAPGMDFEALAKFRLGRQVFNQTWVPGAGSEIFDGLGPLYNAASCAGCHKNDGRGRPPPAGGQPYKSTSMILKLGQPAPENGANAAMVLDPVYGAQLQDFAVPGALAEGQIGVAYQTRQVKLPGGVAVELRRPEFSVKGLAFGPLGTDTRTSARIAPQMIGLGLLARIPQSAIAANADQDDRDGDGISGRVNQVSNGAPGKIGRFGWKAGKATLGQQVSAALSLDMGLANPARPAPAGDCTVRQPACRGMADGRSPDFENLEAHSVLVDWLVHYSANLAVPARRSDAAAASGEAVFNTIGCSACHRPAFTTGTDPQNKHLGARLIRPYTDLLLHDMGPGLADGVTEGLATGAEWRTAPLWGIGLAARVNGNGFYLHDGRARSLSEAILWHGGEAAKSSAGFAALSPPARAELLAFLNNL